MDELELLKKDWQKEESKYPKLSYNDIYKMILKKSSSIVKWIFIISILEFVFWTAISFLLKDADFNQRFQEYSVDSIIIPLSVIGYIILGYFFYRFYMNYRTISVTDSAKLLMEKILKTRRTVRQYVAFNLIYLVIASIVVVGIQMKKDDQMISLIENASANGEIFMFYAKFFGILIIILGIAIGLFLLFYYFIYGLLLKRLNRNYRELKKLEI